MSYLWYADVIFVFYGFVVKLCSSLNLCRGLSWISQVLVVLVV